MSCPRTPRHVAQGSRTTDLLVGGRLLSLLSYSQPAHSCHSAVICQYCFWYLIFKAILWARSDLNVVGTLKACGWNEQDSFWGKQAVFCIERNNRLNIFVEHFQRGSKWFTRIYKWCILHLCFYTHGSDMKCGEDNGEKKVNVRVSWPWQQFKIIFIVRVM